MGDATTERDAPALGGLDSAKHLRTQGATSTFEAGRRTSSRSFRAAHGRTSAETSNLPARRSSRPRVAMIRTFERRSSDIFSGS